MKKAFLITDDPALRHGLQRCAAAHDVELLTTARWSDARDILIKEHFDAVFIDYGVMKLEGLDAFILLDNVLQKERTIASLILRKPSARARQFIDSLACFGPPIELHGQAPSAETLREPFKACLGATQAARAPQQRPGDSVVGPLLVEVFLQTEPEATFAQVSLARALYTLAYTEASGTLFLKYDQLERQFAVYNGGLRAPPTPRFSSPDELASCFAWASGSYRFEQGSVPSGHTENPYPFIYRGIERHMPARQVMQAMMPNMRAYPVRTNLWARRAEGLSDLALLGRFMQACDGQTTLERALSALGAQASRGFQAALFASETDLIVLRDEPTFQSVNLQYNREITRIRQQQVEDQSRDSKAYRAQGSGRASMEAELAELLKRLERTTPYEIFDVWEGCGQRVVRDKFYAMVKQHHPDVYGGNISGDVKRLVQEIFITIKDTYDELMKIEREQLRPRPEPQEVAPGEGLGAEGSFGAEPTPARQAPGAGTPGAARPAAHTPPSNPAQARTTRLSIKTPAPTASSPPADGVRQSQIERLKVKRSATPIGLGREPSVPLGFAKTQTTARARTESTAERREKLQRIRANSNSGKSITGVHSAAETAAAAFNEGYSAWREHDNIALAADRFATAYNLESSNGKYMTFYGYFLFLKDARLIDDALRILEKALEFKDRQSLPDAHVFIGNLLTVKEKHRQALRHYEIALRLNPRSRDAQRAIRLHEKRSREAGDAESSPFWKSLFKK